MDTENQAVFDYQNIAIVVAHPDDEVLWAGGMMLMHTHRNWRIATLCRASDPDRAPRFRRVLEETGAYGDMGDLDDGPEQTPLPRDAVDEFVGKALAANHWDLVITHAPWGEYTRHRRHEEVSASVARLWGHNVFQTNALWMFAYSDDGGKRLPEAIRDAHVKFGLRAPIWKAKYRLITEVYGFSPDSWEARTTPCWEAFWCFDAPGDYTRWFNKETRLR